MSDRGFALRFALWAFAALAVAIAIAMPLARRNAESHARSTVHREAVTIGAVVDVTTAGTDPRRPLPPLMAQVMRARFAAGQALLVELFGPNGRLRFSSRPAAVDLHPGAGTRTRLRLPDGTEAEAIVARTPLRDGGTLAVYRPWKPIAAQIRSDVLWRAVNVLVALGVLYAALFPILLRLLRDRRSAERSAHRQGQLAEAIVEGASEGIWLLDPRGRITFANAQISELLGLPAEQMVGRTIADLAAGQPRGGLREQLLLRRADGSSIWTLVSTHPLGSDGGAVAFVADIDELKGSERSLREATQRLSAIVAAQREVAELELDLDSALTRVVERARDLTGADGAALYFVDGDRLAPRVTIGVGAEVDGSVPLHGSLAGLAVKTGEVTASGDVQADARTWEVARESDDVRSAVLVPLPGENGSEAVLGILYSLRDAFDDEAVETARLMAEFAAAALRNAEELRAKEELATALAESEERFRSAIDSSPIGFALCTPDDEYLLVNDAYCRIVGRTREELTELTWQDLTYDDDVESGRELKRRLLEGELRHSESEQRLLRGDGEMVWVRTWLAILRTPDGSPRYGVAQIQDVTERRLLEQSLRDRERLLRAIFDQSLVATLLFADEGRVILDANMTAAELAGLPREQLIGRSLDDFAPAESAFEPVWEDLARDGVVRGEAPILRPDGGRRVVAFSARAHVRPGVHLTTIQDVTEQRQLEERLRQGQKMEAVGRLAGGIAHDFNNMLTAIGGYADLLLAGTDAGSDAHRHAEQIDGAARRAAALTRQLLAFSRRQVLQPAALDLNDVVERTRDLVTRLIGEDVRLETLLSPSTEPVFADAGQLEQVIVNLAVNARDAMPRGGVLSLETGTVNVDPEQAREAVATPGRYAQLTISDTGVGMDAEQLARLFEPFYSTKGDAGTGLGLATVYGIVRQSGGFVTVQSEPGRGSSFRIFLPATGLPAARVEEPDRPAAAQERGSGTVLLVEDEEIVRAIVAEMLESNGYQVVGARDGEEAVQLAATHDGRIDALVTDVVMPRMSGQEVAERVLEAHPEIRTLFVSGYTESAIANHGVLAPGTSFLEKPFTADDLARKLHELLDATPVA